jgi:broad specificity phosphatase PhoE
MQAPKLVAIFVRHGQTEANKERRFRGAMEIPLDNVGRQQALDARGFIAAKLGAQPLGSAYTSSKQRTQETGNLFFGGPGRTKIVKDFDALNVGKFSGQKKTDENMKEIMHYQKNPDEKIPGGERITDFRKRVDPNIKKMLEEGEESGKPTIAFVHSSIIHEVSHLLHHDHNAVKVTPGGIVGVYKRPNGSYYAQALLHGSNSGQDKEMMS